MRRIEQQPTVSTPLVVAVYARYSDEENQGGSSIDDQVRVCRQCAQSKGWIFDSSLIFADAGISGETLSTRPNIVKLIAAVEAHSHPFDGVVLDDTSRLGRNTAHVLHVCNLMKYHGVFLYFVNQGLDSRDRNFDQLIIPQAAADEQFNHKLRQGVVRGLQGRILNGYAGGGSHFGYKAEIVLDESRRGSVARPAIHGVRLIVDAVEAHTIRRIFDLADEGLSLKKIAARCASEKLPLPARSKAPTWTANRVRDILRNERFRGRQIWGRTTTMKHPETGKVKSVPAPESEWTIKDVPELAIVTDEQFERVRRIIASHKSFGTHKLGGIGRRKDPRPPLLSGNLLCGECNNSIAVAGHTSKGNRVLQCTGYSRLHMSCKNSLRVIEDTLEEAVVNHLTREVLRPDLLEFTIKGFHEALQRKLQTQAQEAKNKRATLPALNREKRQIESAIEKVVESLIKQGSSKALRAKLDELETRLGAINKQQATIAPVSKPMSFEDARSFVLERSKSLADLLLSNRNAAQAALRKHVGTLTLTPAELNGLPAFRVSAGVTLFPDSTDEMPLENLQDLQQQWKDFRMKFVLHVPACSHKQDPLKNQGCDPKRLSQLIAAGATVSDIAKAQQTTEYMIRRALQALNLKPVHKPVCQVADVLRLRKQGKSILTIAAELRVSPSPVYAILRSAAESSGQKFKRIYRGADTYTRINYLRHPKVPVNEMLSLRRKGLTLEELGAHFGVSKEVIRLVARAHKQSVGQRPSAP